MKKSKFLTFVLSLLPGLGHMYLGLFKRGIQIMLMFFLSTYLAGNVWGIFGFLIPVIWCFSFFEALKFSNYDVYTLEGMDRGIIADILGTNIFKSRNGHMILAFALIGIGVLLILSKTIVPIIRRILPFSIFNSLGSFIFAILIALGLIFLGLKIIKGSKGGDNY